MQNMLNDMKMLFLIITKIIKASVLNSNHQLIIIMCQKPNEMKKKYVNNGYAFILSNDYDKICMNIHDYMKGIKHFCNKDTLEMHYKVIHRIEK